MLTPELVSHISGRPLLPSLPKSSEHRIQELSEKTTLPDPKNIQGDVYLTLPRDYQSFMFFTIQDPKKFVKDLVNFNPTTSHDVAHDSLHKIATAKMSGERARMWQTQIAFSRQGLDILGHKEKVQDEDFDVTGPVRSDKDSEIFRGSPIHGLIMVAASDKELCIEGQMAINEMFGGSIAMRGLEGQSRPDSQRGHEHFGYKDGISQPALRGLVEPQKGQPQCDPGVVIMGYPGDPLYNNPHRTPRPAWTKGGSLMAFRKFEQKVPEFRKYVVEAGPKWKSWMPQEDLPKIQPELTDREGAALFGARLFGRWMSGAPIARAPYRDDPKQTTKDTIQDFDFVVPGQDAPNEQLCPFTAHIRKTVPRNLEPFVTPQFLESTLMVRSGIPYGPEVGPDEANETKQDRGLLFVSYQSTLGNGFVAQTSWANNDYFPSINFEPTFWGQDPIIGHPAPAATVVQVSIPGEEVPKGRLALEVQNNPPNMNVTLVEGTAKEKVPPVVAPKFFVHDRGGDYFFVPSIETLKKWTA